MVKKLITATRFRVAVSDCKKVQIQRIDLKFKLMPRLKGEATPLFYQKVTNL